MKSRDELGVFIVEGDKFVKEIPASHQIVQYVVSDEYKKPSEILKRRAKVLAVGKAAFERVAQTKSPQGILAVVEKKHYSFEDIAKAFGFVLVCENINDPGNVGSLMRTAAAANASGIVLTKECASAWNPKVQRASAGAALSMPIVSGADIGCAVGFARKLGMPIYAAHPAEGVLPYDINLSERFCLVLGSESTGLSKAAKRSADFLVRLPMSGNMDSLSVPVAGSIIMYEAVRQRDAASGTNLHWDAWEVYSFAKKDSP